MDSQQTIKPYVIGLDLGGTNAVFGIVDSHGYIKASTAIKTQAYTNAEDFVRSSAEALQVIIDQVGGDALENVEMVWDTVVDEIKGENQVEAVSVTNRKTGEKKDLAVNGIFIAVGITPNSELVSGKLEMDAQGYIKAQEDGVTSVEGVYAAGDVRTKQLRQILTAASDGANCVTSVQNHLLYS